MMEFFSENCNREKAESSMFHKAVNTTRRFQVMPAATNLALSRSSGKMY